MVPNGPENRAVAEILQSMAAEAGFDLKLRIIEFATSIKQGRGRRFQLYLFGWSGRVDPDGNSFIIHGLQGAAQTSAGYCEQGRSNAWHMEARAKSDPAERKKIYEKITAKFPARRQHALPLPSAGLIAYSDRLDGYMPMPDGLVRVVGLKLNK